MELSEEKKALVKGWMLKSPPFATESSSKLITFRRPKAFRPRWRRRFFVLYRISGSANGINHCLLYYKNKQLAKVKGSIDLGKAKDIVTHVMPPDSILSDIPSRLTRHFNKAADSQLPFFQLDTKHKSHDRTYFFLPDSVSQMENWARSISLACGLAEEVESNDEQAMRPQQTQQFPVGITLIQQTGLLSTQPMLQRPPPPPPPRLQPAAVDDADSEAYKLPAELQADLVAEGVYGVPAEDPSVYRVPSPVPELAAARADDVYGTPPPISAEQQQQLLEQQAESSPTPPPRKNALKQPRVPPPESAAPVPTLDATDSGVGQRDTAVSEVRRSTMSRIFTQRRSAVPAAPAAAAAVAANDEFLAPMPLPRRLRAGTNASSEDDLTESDSDSADSDSAEDSGSLGSDLGRLGYAQLDFKPRLQADWHGGTRGQQRGPATVEYTELARPLGTSHK
ncbi:hypothetical protein BOX15_Mlig006277g2 [Macrostomum lignano]|uniref:PH domain-containing protein n=2 Tax=Macrostomum lignano TaxID=282301 RepID=A0A267DDY8_9PLAT|nr:hypothetical protein BOX15_Mlig006277g1 [Macrostomum lignano]PAA75022.1 hypothetical protein BOX15_Mlig006277g2 [Macrostomum lignano]